MQLKTAKLALLSAARTAGVEYKMLQSAWRQQRLPIICFHGVSIDDEHECFPGLFITQKMFREKLSLLYELSINVLELPDAVDRLAHGTLPPRSAVITIDDGYFGIYSRGAGILSEFGFPATVYVPTHYLRHNRPVFDNMCGYLLWQASGRLLDWDSVVGKPVVLDAKGRRAAEQAIRKHAATQELSSEAKNELLADLASRLGGDYDDLCRRRMFHLINPDEVGNWRGARFELHTHRHRVSNSRTTFLDSVRRNRDDLRSITGYESRHFAYPGGAYLPEHIGWLRELGIKSATTCETGLASQKSNPLLLPRIVDGSRMSVAELRGWLTGVAELLPVRPSALDVTQFEPVYNPRRAGNKLLTAKGDLYYHAT